MQKILVTGARSGIINKVIDKIQNDYFIYLTVRTEKQLQIVKEKYKNNSNIECFKLDVLNESDRKKIESLDIDIFISNAAIGEGGSITEIDIDKVKYNYEVNVFSNFRIIQLVLKQMLKKNKGKIIVVSSLASHLPIKFLGSYCSTKASISMLTKVLRKELKLINKNIKIQLIEPGLYHTGFNQVMLDNKYDWMDINSYFNNILKEIKRNDKLFCLLEKTNLNSIVNKIVYSIKTNDNKFLYSAPTTQYIMAKLYNLFE